MVFRVLVLLCVGIVYIRANEIRASGVNQQDIETIVNGHNGYRLDIANGRVKNQPKGVNLKRIKWDTKLAAAAQNISNRCVFGHVIVKDGRFYVGQNIYETSSTGYDNKGPDWGSVMRGWFSENIVYHYPDNPGQKTGHYTQMVWANTELIGCGWTYCSRPGQRFPYAKEYVCNYGPGGNIVGQPPYQKGTKGCENLC